MLGDGHLSCPLSALYLSESPAYSATGRVDQVGSVSISSGLMSQTKQEMSDKCASIGSWP